MGILNLIVLIFVLYVFDARHHFGLRCTITLQLVCNDHTRGTLQFLQQLAKNFLAAFISVALDQDVQYVAILIHRAPNIMEAAVELEEYFVEMPYVEICDVAVSVNLAELKAPLSDGLLLRVTRAWLTFLPNRGSSGRSGKITKRND